MKPLFVNFEYKIKFLKDVTLEIKTHDDPDDCYEETYKKGETAEVTVEGLTNNGAVLGFATDVPTYTEVSRKDFKPVAMLVHSWEKVT